MQENPTKQPPEAQPTPSVAPQPIYTQPTEPEQPPKKKKHGPVFWVVLSLAILAVLVIIAPIAAIVGFGVLLGTGCNSRTEMLEKHQVSISEKLNKVEGITAPYARANGDCLTGSGTSIQFESNQPYENSVKAREDIFSKLRAQGLPAPEDVSKTTYVFANDGASSSGGNTPIAEIEVIYYSEGSGGSNATGESRYDSYTVDLKVPQAYSCEVIDSETVMCNGMEKTAFLQQILETQPLTNLRVEAQIRAPK